jgi:hypothetical protein
MDERDTEEERKDRETEWWGIERKMLFLEVFSFNFVEIKLYAGIWKPVGRIKQYILGNGVGNSHYTLTEYDTFSIMYKFHYLIIYVY